MKEIPLRNKNKEITGYTSVSDEDYQLLNKFTWCKSGNNYVVGNIKGKAWRMHRYILIEILGKELTSKIPIDHIDNDPLNNQRENLRIVTISENSRNKKKKENCSSEYTGVIKIILKSENVKWRVAISINNKKLQAIYDIEKHAAWQYNLWVDEFKLKYANKNDINEPENFAKWKNTKEKINDLPTGVTNYKNTGKFIVGISIDSKKQHIGIFDTIEEATMSIQKAEKERDLYYKNKILAIPKNFNKDGFCFFKIKEIEVIIDEEIFYEIMKYKWRNKENYIIGRVNGKTIYLSRFIMNYSGDNYIDHKNNNVVDNRKCNLRIVTPRQNSMNKIGRGTSKFIGVSFFKRDKKWIAQIAIEGKPTRIGIFEDEIDAAKARDAATKQYFGEYGKLNFP